ncbi:hypothetical protein TIFTF001_026473 [Ficus carica]|uniref:t-SNARE coiled-coil homology domain-containing protein n=1 Tax=Ficus carica TaxID=3494 RepID=A0AA88DLA9_FICCA|nr:hypothetical protein TIFTF001_026473 [Ficus carica]
MVGNEIAFNEAIIEEREQGIRDIEEQIGEANEIFKDLAVLVHEQGAVIDDIHSNIEDSSAAATQTRVQLAKASKSVKSRCSLSLVWGVGWGVNFPKLMPNVVSGYMWAVLVGGGRDVCGGSGYLFSRPSPMIKVTGVPVHKDDWSDSS